MADQSGVRTEHEGAWRRYGVGSRDEAYAELERIERQRADEAKGRPH
jgi:hypothetical protein